MVLTVDTASLFTPELILILIALALLFSPKGSRRATLLMNDITVVGLLLSMGFLTVYLARSRLDEWILFPEQTLYFNGHLEITLFSQLVKLAFVGTALMVALASRSYMAGAKNQTEFHFLLIAATLGMMVVGSSRDLLIMFVGLELASLSSYALVAHRKGDDLATEAGAKYFLIGAFSSALAIYGMSLVYGAANTLNFQELQVFSAGQWSNTVFIGGLFMLAGFGFKVAIVPFHAWAPDVYQGAPTTVTAYLAAASKMVGFVVLFKVFLVGMIGFQDDWRLLVALVAIASMTLGNLVALSQTSFRRMLAYSSIAQAGYVLIALAAVHDYTGDGQDTSVLVVGAAVAHLIVHIFMKGGAFLALSVLALRGYGDNINEMKGLATRRPWIALSLTVFLFSLAGIPPLAGFWSKFWLFYGAVQAGLETGNDLLILLAVAAVLNSALSLFYYLRIVRYMFVSDETEKKPHRDEITSEDVDDGEELPAYPALPVLFSAMVLLFGLPLLFNFFFRVCQNAARALLGV